MKSELDHFRELIDHRFQALNKALELKAAQDKIHFEALNHEADQLKDMRAELLSTGVFLQFKESIDKRLGDLETAAAKESGRKGVYAGLYALAVILLVVFLNYIMRPSLDSNLKKIEDLEQKLNKLHNE